MMLLTKSSPQDAYPFSFTLEIIELCQWIDETAGKLTVRAAAGNVSLSDWPEGNNLFLRQGSVRKSRNQGLSDSSGKKMREDRLI